mgnify:CR=1 FL=1
MRIMLCLAGAAHGGAETFFVDLATAFARAGVEIAPVIRPNAVRHSELRRAGARVRTAPYGRWLDMRTGPVLRRTVAEVEPDVVLAFMNRAAAWMPGGPHVKAARLGGYYDLKYYRRCEHLLCITPAIREHVVARGWPGARAHVLPNFATVDNHLPEDRTNLNTPRRAPVLLVPSRLHRNKGLDVMLRALAQLPGVICWLAGDGPARTELGRLALELGVVDRVRFLGWRADKGALYRAADVVVFPSRYEPFGTVSLEAWAYERPLVTTDADGPAGLVTPERDALMVPREDPDALAAAIRRVLDDPRLAARLVAAGRTRYHEGYTEAACVARYLDLFRRLIADRADARETG